MACIHAAPVHAVDYSVDWVLLSSHSSLMALNLCPDQKPMTQQIPEFLKPNNKDFNVCNIKKGKETKKPNETEEL